ncbi:uncharacterized protein LOC142163929 [Nicotiana tabacum]|uniref:Uncharacterized protein LOC142163929 n=1 Tax=Nicotiana tabacum TaxID=4097 RepID=A0AC58RWX5_TOBAC
MDSGMPTRIERPKKVPIHPPVTVKIRGRRVFVNISGGLGSSSKCCFVLREIRELSIIHIPREENVQADALANLGSSTEIKGPDSGTVVQLLHSALDVDGYFEVNSTNLVWDWRNKFIEYLRYGKLPEDPKASWAQWTKAARYCLVAGQLYRRSFQGPLARYLGASEADYMMRKAHEGVCWNHSSADSLVLKLIMAGYYWPQMEQDAKAFVRKCDKGQRHALLVYQPAELLHSVAIHEIGDGHS